MGYDAEVHQVTLTNESDAAKDVILTSFVEFCLWNAQDDMLNFQRNFSTGEVEIEDGVIYHKTEYRERRNHYSFYAVNTPIDGYDTDMETFLGLYNGFENPQAVLTGKMGNSKASGWQPMAAHQIKVHLEKGEEKKFNFVLGYVELPQADKWAAPGIINKAPAKELLSHLTTDEQIDEAFAALKAHWDNLLSAYTLTTDDEKLGRMVNIWNPYQCMVTFNMSRSTSMFESGIGRGMGFRDSSQDLLGFVHQIPERARERILDIAATQFRDGGCYHQYQPLTKKGNNDIGGGFNDDPLWLIAGTAAYIKETGDFSILDEKTPYDCNPDDYGTLMEHLEVSFYHVVNNKGPHGLPLIGRADWNDCLNLNCFSEEPGESFQTSGPSEGPVAESVPELRNRGPFYKEAGAKPYGHEKQGKCENRINPAYDFVKRCLENGKSVVVCAPTGAGKTCIAEFAIQRALKNGERIFYTTPLKALSNQKFSICIFKSIF